MAPVATAEIRTSAWLETKACDSSAPSARASATARHRQPIAPETRRLTARPSARTPPPRTRDALLQQLPARRTERPRSAQRLLRADQYRLWQAAVSAADGTRPRGRRISASTAIAYEMNQPFRSRPWRTIWRAWSSMLSSATGRRPRHCSILPVGRSRGALDFRSGGSRGVRRAQIQLMTFFLSAGTRHPRAALRT